MVCPKCGKRNKKDAAKCVVCGKKLISKNVSQKKDNLIDSITSSIDVKAIKKAEKSLVNNIKRLSPKIIVVSICVALLAFLLIFLTIGRGVTCSFKSYEGGLYYRLNINFNHKKNKITRFSQRIEYSANDTSKREYLSSIYDNIMNDMKQRPNYKDIVSSSKSKRHFSIVYSFSPNYIDNVKDYTPYDFSEYDNVNDFINSLNEAGFKCR